MSFNKSLIALILMVLGLPVFGQNDLEKLAAQFLADGEFAKAAEIYEDLSDQRPESVYIYDNYLKCLLELNEDKKAKKLVKRQLRRFPNNMVFAVDEGYIQYKTDQNEAEEIFSELIRDFASSPTDSRDLANAFLKRDFIDWSVKAYQAARKKSNSEMLFGEELMDLYSRLGDFESLTNECLNLVQQGVLSESEAQKNLELVLDQGKFELVRTRVLTFNQKYPNRIEYDKLLVWVFVQNKRYASALRQVKSLDKKTGAEGGEIMMLARTFARDGAWEDAEKGYRAVVELGKESPYYSKAEAGILQAAYEKLKQSFSVKKEDAQSLIDEQNAFINEYGVNNSTALVVRQKAELFLFVLHDVESAIKSLEELVQTPGLNVRMRDECKLLLGDAYVVVGNVWDAQLTYSQVDKAFKEDPLGQEAKFRNARLSYFRSDFEWAKDQLEVLKTATTQLISNNAIELSLLIQDNTEMDTTSEALSEFAQAELLLFQQKHEECLSELNRLAFKYATHSLIDEITMMKGKTYEARGEIEEALKQYERVYENYPYDITADNAIFRAAEIYLNQLDDKSKALALYEKIILDYGDSLFVVEARKRYKELSKELGTP